MSAGRRGVASAWAREELESLAARGLRRFLEPLEPAQGAVVRVGGETLINFSSNDYLGLAASPTLARRGHGGAGAHGVGTGASRVVVGDTPRTIAWRQRLAAFERAEAALLFNSGYAANLGIIPALVGSGDAVFSDALNHASLVDGCRLSRARVGRVSARATPRRSPGLLAETPARRKLVVTDTVFSMDGDLAPLRELLAGLPRARRRADGGRGPRHRRARARGRGAVRGAGRRGRGGPARGHAEQGARVPGRLRRPPRAPWRSCCSTGPARSSSPPRCPRPLCAAAEAAVDVVEQDAELASAAVAQHPPLRRGPARAGRSPPSLAAPSSRSSSATPERRWTPLDAAGERGLLVKAIRPPTVPEGTSRLRFCLSAAHTEGHIDLALEVLRQLGVHRGG